ncbi:uncharacterized protein JCM10292_005242 [Rhodotorula paludigena]|uniref:uncharacterized protein n=1 Tax=Rhodotorula paludigena TaxID=86838 RepID=UPI0031771380
MLAGTAPAPDAPVPPQPALGRRAKVTQDALVAASNKVIGVLDDKAVRQCFPQKWADDYPDLVPGLRQMVVDTYNAGVPLAWDDLVRSHRFIEKANELDQLLEDAKGRKERGEPPKNLYQTGLDGTITIPSATVPVLRTAIEELREKRKALAARNDATFERVASLSRSTNSLEAQNEAILTHFAASMQALKEIDEKAVLELQDELVRIVGTQL